MTFKKSLLDKPGFLVGEAPSKPVLRSLPQQFAGSEHERHWFEKVLPRYGMLLLEKPSDLLGGVMISAFSFGKTESFVRLTKGVPI
ncbi:hypothetical protein A3K71_00550 [archaeon RBG_16_50_20]|nr:MAG: hypothetical protein A3K71_00550 [archaeon RBG_16_50_20]